MPTSASSSTAGFAGVKRVLVPYLGGRHDRLALELAGRFGTNARAEVTVLHVVAPGRRKGEKLDAEGGGAAGLQRPIAAAWPVQFKVVEHASPVDAVLQEAHGFDLVLVGVSEEWGLESHLFGWKPERIAKASKVPC